MTGPATVFKRYDDSELEQKYRRHANSNWIGWGDHMIPGYARTTSADAIRAIICFQEFYTKVGMYDLGDVMATRAHWDVRIIRWPSGELVAAKWFSGPDPPKSTSAGRNNEPRFVSGEGPVNEAIRWIAEVITR